MGMITEFHSDNISNRREWAAKLPHDVRYDMIENLLFEYPGFKAGMAFLKRFHIKSQKLQKAGTGRIGGVIGEFRSGKSFLIQNYARDYPSVIEGKKKVYPVLYLDARREWDAKEMARQILKLTDRPHRDMSIAQLNTKALERMTALGTKLLIIDDAHCLIGKKGVVANSFYGFIQEAVERRICNVLLSGPPVVQAAILERDELRGRGNFPRTPVKSFSLATETGKKNYRLFLGGVDNRLPFLEPTDFLQPAYYDDLKAVSRGSIGETMNLIKDAAFLALDDGARKIELEHFRTALHDMLDEAPVLKGAA